MIQTAEQKYLVLLGIGPITSDTLISLCLKHIEEIASLVEEADEFYDKAIKAGSYYNLKGTSDAGVTSADNLRFRLETQQTRLVRSAVLPPHLE